MTPFARWQRPWLSMIGAAALIAWTALCAFWLVGPSAAKPSEDDVQSCLADGVHVTRVDCQEALRSPLAQSPSVVLVVWLAAFVSLAALLALTVPWRTLFASPRFRSCCHLLAVMTTAVMATALGVIAAFVAPEGSESFLGWLFFLGPVVVGAIVAAAALGRAIPLLVGAMTFIALGGIALWAIGADGRAEGGDLLVAWVVVLQIAGLYAAAAVWWGKRQVERRRAGRRANRIVPQTVDDEATERSGQRARRPHVGRWVVGSLVATSALVLALVRANVFTGPDTSSASPASAHNAEACGPGSGHARCVPSGQLHLSGRLAFETGDGIVVLDLVNRRKRLVEHLGGSDPAWSPDGKSLAFEVVRYAGGDEDEDLYVTSLAGSPRRITRGPVRDWEPSWSPDGRRLAFQRFGTCPVVNGTVEAGCPTGGIIVATPDGTRLRKIAETSAGTASPAWSPDGKTVAFSTQGPRGLSRLWRVAVDGGGLRELVPTLRAEGLEPTWSPDGRRIAYSCGLIDSFDVCLARADGSHRRRLTHGLDSLELPNPAWSPDGKWIAFAADNGVRVMRADGKVTAVLLRSGGNPAWTR